ncbi:MAG: hypothetical protein RLZZ214_2963 [Verrucomicrobiota bacterium]
METPTDNFIRALTQRHRVSGLGGLAVIAHGFSRSTFDGDIWLDPMGSSSEWSNFLENACTDFGGLTLHRLPCWIPVSGQDLVGAVDETHMIRIQGLDCPLDVFRKPNEIEISDFDSFGQRAATRGDGTLLPDPLDLIQSKFDTAATRICRTFSIWNPWSAPTTKTASPPPRVRRGGRSVLAGDFRRPRVTVTTTPPPTLPRGCRWRSSLA